MPIRAIVTGGPGFIGSHVADGLLARGDAVVVVDNLASGRRERVPAGADLRELDVRDGAALKALAAEFEPQAWFHLAAQADVRVSVADPGFDADVNVRGTAEVVEAARTTEARVVFSSTGGAIYGEVDTIPSPESTPCAAMAPESGAKDPWASHSLFRGAFETKRERFGDRSTTASIVHLQNRTDWP